MWKERKEGKYGRKEGKNVEKDWSGINSMEVQKKIEIFVFFKFWFKYYCGNSNTATVEYYMICVLEIDNLLPVIS